MVAQAQSMPMTQEEKNTLDKYMPHIIEQMKIEFVSKTEFIPVKKAVTDHKTIIEEWNPMLIHHHNGIDGTPGEKGMQGKSGQSGLDGQPGPGQRTELFKKKISCRIIYL